MKITQPFQLLILVLLVVLAASCSKDINQGRASIEGSWKVTDITSSYGDFTIDANGNVISMNTTTEKTETGALGFFTFSNDAVTYSFTRFDTLYTGSGTWELNLEKVNQGFTKVNKWSLVIANDYVFDVRFEDQTKNAEKNARSVELDNYPTKSGPGVAIFLKLKKE